MRLCCQCGVPDHEIPQPYGAESVHLVVPEVKYLSRAEDFSKQKHGSKGWAPKMFQGRSAITRMICVNCINANRLRDRVWAGLKADALKMEKPKNPDGDFYAVLCN